MKVYDRYRFVENRKAGPLTSPDDSLSCTVRKRGQGDAMFFCILVSDDGEYRPFLDRQKAVLIQSLFQENQRILFAQKFIIPKIDRALNFNVRFNLDGKLRRVAQVIQYGF